MSRSLSPFQSVLLGVVVLVAIGLAALGLFAIGNGQGFWSKTFEVRANFSQVRGVEKGTRVRVQGMDAGEVVAVEPPDLPNSPIHLRLRLRSELRHLLRANASAQIVSEGMLGGKVIEINPGSEDAQPISDDAILAARPSVELNDLMDEVGASLKDIRQGKGALGTEVHLTVQQARSTLESFQQTMDSAKHVTEAAKRLPFFRNYVKNEQALLIRADHEVKPYVFTETELFEPGGTSLTVKGKQNLDRIAPEVLGLLKHEKAELVVVARADPKMPNATLALAVTEKQADAVLEYLRTQHTVHKASWFSSREVSALGLGNELPVVEFKAGSPPARIEVVVFVPRKK